MGFTGIFESDPAAPSLQDLSLANSDSESPLCLGSNCSCTVLAGDLNQEPRLGTYDVSLYMHVSLLYGVVKLGLTTAAGGPRECGQHAKVYFPATHKAAFGIKLHCENKNEAARQVKRYEALAFHILSVFVLCGEVWTLNLDLLCYHSIPASYRYTLLPLHPKLLACCSQSG